ncbi:MAG: DUF4358 domain-containing protein [Eubacteriaceae bacterium]|nr:DUF4358 domain-containing protein [Eubacteriaceae bacterium]
MKKILSIMMIFLLIAGICACDKPDDGGEKHYITVTEYTLKKDMTLEDMAKQIRKQYGFDMPMEISDKTLESLFHITPSAVEEYAGVFSISMSSADNVLIVKPVKGKDAVVKFGIDQRKQDVVDTFTGYLEASLKQAENSFVMERDGYYIYLSVDEDRQIVEEYIDATFFDVTEKQVEVDGPADQSDDVGNSEDINITDDEQPSNDTDETVQE